MFELKNLRHAYDGSEVLTIALAFAVGPKPCDPPRSHCAMACSSDAPELTGETAPSVRQRSLRALLASLVLSLALHLTLLATWPALVRDREPPHVRVLDVVLLKPEPLPAAAPEPARIPTETIRAAADRRKPETPKPRTDDPQEPATRGPAPSPVTAPAESIPTEAAPAPQPIEARTAPSGQKPEATAAVTPPSYNATYLRNPPPRYPLVARRNGEQGTVTLRVLVTREGLPASVSVEKTSGSSQLDSAALETVKTWRFMPARQGAQPVEAWVLVPIVFKLEGVS